MTTTVKGIAEFFSAKYSEKAKGTLYSVKVDGVWYGFNKNKIAANKGDLVTFEATQKGDFWNGDPKTFKVLASEAQAEQPRAVPTGAGKYSPGAEDTRQRSIIYQHSQEMAISWVQFLVAQGAVKVGTAKAASQLALDKLLLEYTDRFAAQAGAKVAAPEVVQKPSSDESAEQAEDVAEADDIPW